MSTYVEIIGNLLQNPEQRTVKVKGVDRRITEIRVYSDVYRRDPDDESKLIQDDAKGFAYNCTIWNERLAEEVMKHLRKGVRVKVQGDLTIQQWDDKETNAPKFALHVDAEECDLRLNRIEEIRFKQKRNEATDSSDSQAA
jgi:single-strand DNA-binding protein